MIDQFSEDGRGWARFSDDMVMRYRLSRSLTDRAPSGEVLARLLPGEALNREFASATKAVVWVMCNPSTADAFVVDPTVRDCIQFSRNWGYDVAEVVNLWALRSPHPADLRKRAIGHRGDDALNDVSIRHACAGASLVIAAWGLNGELDHRAAVVRRLLEEQNIALHHLGMTKDWFPKHPLARGTHRIPRDQQPIKWEAVNGR